MIPTEMTLNLSQTANNVARKTHLFTTVPAACWARLLQEKYMTPYDTMVLSGLTTYLTILVFVADTFMNHVTGHHHIPVTMLGCYSAYVMATPSPRAFPESFMKHVAPKKHLSLSLLSLTLYMLSAGIMMMNGTTFFLVSMMVWVWLAVWLNVPYVTKSRPQIHTSTTTPPPKSGGMKRPVVRSVVKIPGTPPAAAAAATTQHEEEGGIEVDEALLLTTIQDVLGGDSITMADVDEALLLSTIEVAAGGDPKPPVVEATEGGEVEAGVAEGAAVQTGSPDI